MTASWACMARLRCAGRDVVAAVSQGIACTGRRRRMAVPTCAGERIPKGSCPVNDLRQAGVACWFLRHPARTKLCRRAMPSMAW
jgi:hypothetical protein